jgi:hypothetical protein
MSQQAVSADIIPIKIFQLLEYFPKKQKQQRHEQLGYTDKLVTTQIYCRSLKILGPLSNFKKKIYQ